MLRLFNIEVQTAIWSRSGSFSLKRKLPSGRMYSDVHLKEFDVAPSPTPCLTSLWALGQQHKHTRGLSRGECRFRATCVISLDVEGILRQVFCPKRSQMRTWWCDIFVFHPHGLAGFEVCKTRFDLFGTNLLPLCGLLFPINLLSSFINSMEFILVSINGVNVIAFYCCWATHLIQAFTSSIDNQLSLFAKQSVQGLCSYISVPNAMFQLRRSHE